MPRVILAVLVALLLPAPTSAQDAEQFSFAGVAFPEEVAEFAVMRSTRWPDPSLGVALTYVKPGTAAEFSVYVYPATKTLEDEFTFSMDGIRTYAEQNREGIEVVFESEEAVEVAGVAGHLGVTSMNGRGSSRRSLLYVFERDGSVFKYRMTFDRSLRSILADSVDEFVEETLTSIAAPGGGE